MLFNYVLHKTKRAYMRIYKTKMSSTVCDVKHYNGRLRTPSRHCKIAQLMSNRSNLFGQFQKFANCIRTNSISFQWTKHAVPKN